MNIKIKNGKTEDLFACGGCSRVTHQKIETYRVDKEYVYHCTPPHPSHENAKHGMQTVRVCKCGRRNHIKYVSDCKPGYCGIKKINYAGGDIRTGEGYLCPHCENSLSS